MNYSDNEEHVMGVREYYTTQSEIELTTYDYDENELQSKLEGIDHSTPEVTKIDDLTVINLVVTTNINLTFDKYEVNIKRSQEIEV